MSLANGKLLIKDGGSKMEVPVMDAESFVFDIPDLDPIITFPLSKEVVAAIDFAAACSNVDTIKAELMGVTFQAEGGVLCILSTDNATVTRCAFADKVAKKSVQLIIPKSSAQLIGQVYRNLGDSLKSAELMLTADHLAVTYEVSDDAPYTALVCKTITVEQFAGVSDIVDEHTKAAAYVEAPAELFAAMKRSITVCGDDPHRACIIKANGKTLNIESKGSRGLVNASITHTASLGKESISVDPKMVQRAIERCSDMFIGGSFIAFRSEGKEYMIEHIVSELHIVEKE